MRLYRFARVMTAPAVGVWIVPFLLMGSTAIGQGEVVAEAGVQVLTRGPVHEAFAEASMTGSKAGVVITRTAPDPISELPPDQRPEGADVAWIPGYWSWDDDRTDFVWVSGVWRDVPPSRQWVPGYWAPSKGGSRWISGFWGDVAQSETTYLPRPPEPLEAGPSSPAPAPNHMWTSGCWVWQTTRYDWQPGYWVPQQPDWVWSPAHYTWTPRGYVYVQGYWDYDISHRGVMFAPVYYDQPVYRRPDYYYSPTIVIDLGAITAHLFVRPTSHQYYFGDYYDHRYEERGFFPWYSKQVMRYGNDPLYAHYRSAQLRQDPDWDVHVDEQYRHRRDHVDARPPQTLALQINILKTQKPDAPDRIAIGRNLAEAVQSKIQSLRFTAINMDERKQIETRGRQVHKLQSERAKLETPVAPTKKAKGGRDAKQPISVQLPASPVAARPIANAEGARAVPALPVVPKPQPMQQRVPPGNPEKVGKKVDTRQPQHAPLAIQAPPGQTTEEPRGIKPSQEENKAGSPPRKRTSKMEPIARDRKTDNAESGTTTTQNADNPVLRKTPETRQVKRPERQNGLDAGASSSDSAKHEGAGADTRATKPESKTQPPRVDTKKRQTKKDEPSSTEENKKR